MCNIATWLYTKLNGVYVGQDEFGNKYYQSKKADRPFNKKSRWVIYKGMPEPTKVPPQWFLWLHHQAVASPNSNAKKYAWEINHETNNTGTKKAYFPSGHPLGKGKKDKSSGDYEAWKPN
jgi:NADH:ubiquinone oxidoreductase subunit